MTHIRWTRGGDAHVVSLVEDAVVLRSTAPWPPGSRIDGALVSHPSARVRVKVHGSRRQPEGDFVLEGRLLDATRAVRERIARMAIEVDEAQPSTTSATSTSTRKE